MKQVVPSSSWSSMVEFWRSSPAFRCLAVSCHFYSAGIMLMLTGLPFYFEVVLEYTPEQVETAMRAVFLGVGLMVPLALPLVAYLSKRFDPSMISGIGGLLAIIIGACHAHASHGIPGQFWPQMLQISIICGVGLGLLTVSWTSSQSALFTLVVDEDQVRQAEIDGKEEVPARRDGMINSFKTAFQISAVAWAGVFQFILGALGYDGERFSKGEPQPVEVRICVEVVSIFVFPGMFVLFAIPMLRFPLRGERLAKLMSDYSRLYDRLVINCGSPSASRPVIGKPWVEA